MYSLQFFSGPNIASRGTRFTNIKSFFDEKYIFKGERNFKNFLQRAADPKTD